MNQPPAYRRFTVHTSGNVRNSSLTHPATRLPSRDDNRERNRSVNFERVIRPINTGYKVIRGTPARNS